MTELKDILSTLTTAVQSLTDKIDNISNKEEEAPAESEPAAEPAAEDTGDTESFDDFAAEEVVKKVVNLLKVVKRVLPKVVKKAVKVLLKAAKKVVNLPKKLLQRKKMTRRTILPSPKPGISSTRREKY